MMLTAMALKMRTKSHEGLQTSVGVLLARHLLEIVVLAQFYFSSTSEVKMYMKFIVSLIFFINLVLIKVFIDLESQFSVYWAPVVLLDIVLHFYIFIQMAYDYTNFEKTK
jgi:hypothetical protein